MEELRMTPRGLELIEKVEATLEDTERRLMAINIKLGDILYDRYHNRMGFNPDGSYSRDGRVVWPERMVEDG